MFKLRIKTYRGAGILFWYRDAHGCIYVLLAQRKAGPQWWSLCGGGMEGRDHRDFAACARRETCEEFGCLPEEMLVPKKQPEVVRYHWPGYCWSTYLVELTQRPEDGVFPSTKARDYRHEFLRHKWFPLRLGELPWRLNLLCYPALLRLCSVSRKIRAEKRGGS